VTKKIINNDDIDLFRQTVGNVRSLNHDKVVHVPPRPKPKPIQQDTDLQSVWLTVNESDISDVGHEESLSFTAPGIQQAVLAKLRKGKFGIQGEIDLHGLTGNVAKVQLTAFIHASVNAGHRCIHIIHGKGYRSADSQPILKNNINRWLRKHKDVQAFCSAPAKHGGAGAVYVLLRKSADNLELFD